MRSRRTDGRPTIADVARLAGVGAITVSRALRDPAQVSEALRRNIDEAIRELDYVPNLSARALASVRADVVAVLVPSLTQSIFSDVLRGVYDGVEGTGFQVQLGNTRYRPEQEERLVAQMLRQKPAGIIVSGTEQNARTREMLKGAGCPVIQIMDLADDPVDAIIGFSHHEAGRAIARHLLEAGYRRIGFVSGWMNGRSLDRFTGFRDVLTEAGIYDPRFVTPIDTSSSFPDSIGRETPYFATPLMARKLLGELLDANPDMDAAFCNNDVLALGGLFECMERGLRVPEDFGIAGFNDFDLMEAAHPSITSVRSPRWECGYDAVSLLRRRLDGEDCDRIVDLGFQVRARASTDRRGRLRSGRAAATA